MLARIILILLFFLIPLSGRAGVFNPEPFELDNGLQVVVIENHRAPIVTHMVWYKVGDADAPPGLSGLPHLLEHLMFKGTKKIGPGDFSKIVARNGGRDNAFTGSDFTAYHQNLAADRLELAMKMEADRMANLVLDPKLIETERQVVLEERRSRTDNEPASRLREKMGPEQYAVHPYRNPVIGWEGDIKAITPKDLRAFYQRWYVPNNAILIVAGDVTPQQVLTLADTYYASIPRRPLPGRERAKEPPPKGPKSVELKDKAVKQPLWMKEYLAPSRRLDPGRQSYALEVLETILSGGATSRLYESLVVRQKLAASAGASYSPDRYDLSEFGFYASPNPGVTMKTLEEAMEAEILKLLADGVTENEVERAKARLIDGAVYARDSLSGGAYALGRALGTGQTIDDVELWPERIGAVTREQVNAAIKSVLRPEAAVIGRLLGETP
ncbi:MAG: insulinase family protein [Rhodospirillales bacterium]|nr:insulinase family protein [Rhodospirillales bacterium]